jgi:uncharacterized membrane protein YsdA (DUF1294 family)/cold shock CspA family protein
MNKCNTLQAQEKNMPQQGKITKWHDAKGFGFITPDSGGKDVFVHIKAFQGRGGRPQNGAAVCYEVSQDEQGRLRAHNACLHKPGIGSGVQKRSGRLLALMASAVFLAAIAGLAWIKKIPGLLLWIYLGMSILTLMFYALDKSAAQNGRWRTPEKNLHLLSLLGGWPGALYAQQLFRHKSSKRSFQVIFWMTMALNMAALVYLLQPEGAELRASLWRLSDFAGAN